MGTDRFAHDTVLQAEPYHYQALSSIWFGQREPLRTHAAAASLFISEPDLTKEGKVWAAEQCRWSLHSAGVVHKIWMRLGGDGSMIHQCDPLTS